MAGSRQSRRGPAANWGGRLLPIQSRLSGFPKADAHALAGSRSNSDKLAGVARRPAAPLGEGVLQIAGKTAGYYAITAASVGLTVGVAQRSEIIMFMTQAALDKFTQSKGWTVGAEAGVAVVSEGAGGTYDSKTFQKPILGFVYGEKGLIGDLSLEGSKITKVEK